MIEHNKTKGLVFEIIKKYATEAEPMDQTDIIAKIEEEGSRCDRKTVGRTLEHLRAEYGVDGEGDWPNENLKLHYTVLKRSSSPIYKAYWFEVFFEDDFTDDELMFLMDAVQFSRHVGKNFAEEIARKLSNLSSDKFNRVLALHTKLNEKNVPVNPEFLKVQGDINKAICERKQVSFLVNEYGIDKKLHPVGERITVCPYKIVVSDGDYYLLCAKCGTEVIKTYRVDRLTDVATLDESFPYTMTARDCMQHPNAYIEEHRFMNSGEAVDVTLVINRSLLGDVIDSFGKKIKINETDESSSRLTVHLKSGERDIIDWVMRYGESAAIEEPEYLREELVERARTIWEVNRVCGNEDIMYAEQLEKVSRLHMLSLRDIDLNGRESYKELDGIRRAVFCNNGIRDFSFLTSYTQLLELLISHNEISNPEVLSELNRLNNLVLEKTGITNLDFLAGMTGLRRLAIDEHSLEDVEAVYSLPHLSCLIVNKAVSRLIDQNRLREIFGESFRYKVDSGHKMLRPLLVYDLPPETERFDFARRHVEELQAFSTIELTDSKKRKALCKKIYTGLRSYPRGDKEFELLNETCEGSERTRLFEDPGHYTGKQYAWYVTYEGEPVDESELDTGSVCAISIFKQDHGLKLVGIAKHYLPAERTDDYRILYDRYYYGLCANIRYLLDNEIGWMELSGDSERLFVRCSTTNDLIDPDTLIRSGIFEHTEIDVDNYHYFRKNDIGKTIKKIAYGSIL